MGSPDILLTNDDGIDSPGLQALANGLWDVGNVTVVAPADNRSAMGRASSAEVTVREHELGYAIEGTPVDCVVAGVEALAPDPDVVVSGINKGANLGMYVLGRSGTVGAAVEAAYFGVPAIATSLYLPGDRWKRETNADEYREAVRATAFLVDHALEEDVFDSVDYLNVNAPAPENGRTDMAITRPSAAYDMSATREGEQITLHDNMWQRMEEGGLDEPPETDRRTVVEGSVSVSPLTVPHTTERHDALDSLAARF